MDSAKAKEYFCREILTKFFNKLVFKMNQKAKDKDTSYNST